jgi:hypothetical protein
MTWILIFTLLTGQQIVLETTYEGCFITAESFEHGAQVILADHDGTVVDVECRRSQEDVKS